MCFFNFPVNLFFMRFCDFFSNKKTLSVFRRQIFLKIALCVFVEINGLIAFSPKNIQLYKLKKKDS